MSNAQGLDVSKWQGSFDWRGHPDIAFAAAKCYEAAAGEDPTFAANWHDMRTTFDNKLVRIAYCFAHPGYSMAAQADTLVELVKDHGLQAGDHFALDLEVTGDLADTEVVSFARQFSHRVNVAAPEHRCIGYTFRDFPAPWGTWPLWLAAPGDMNPVVPEPWKRWWFLQYSQTGLDLDCFNGDRGRLNEFCRMPKDRR